jgi:hypothetical protein
MPYESWHSLHHRDEVQPALAFSCPVCRTPRKMTAHMRKLFLVAERLTWEEGLVSNQDKDLNEELNWRFNYELGILDPFVEDPEHVPGGKNSQVNKCHPYRNEHEMKLAFKLLFMTESLTEASWSLWIGTQLDIETMLNGCGKTDAKSCITGQPLDLLTKPGSKKTGSTVSPDSATDLAVKFPGLPTPPLSFGEGFSSGKHSTNSSASTALSIRSPAPVTAHTLSISDDKCIVSYKTLQDFYTLLGRIERTSYAGALFLEAYAEQLRDDMCKDCWFKHNVKLDMF